MLAVSDRTGLCAVTPGGLAALARISKEHAEDALRVLSEPDPETLTQANDGRRIERVDGGWKLLNWEKYREKARSAVIREQNRQAQERFRNKQNQPQMEGDVPPNKPSLEEAVEHFSKIPKCDFRRSEIEQAYRTFEASKDRDGNWWWGKRLVGDWRAALEGRIHDNRNRTIGVGKPPIKAGEAVDKMIRGLEREAKRALQ